MIKFEDGTLIKGAYVVVNGEELPVHMPEYSGNTPLSSENLNKLQKELLETMFPIGSTYITQEDINPSTILGFGTWERLKGKLSVGLDEENEHFNEIGKTGGEEEVILTEAQIPEHCHPGLRWGKTDGEVLTANAGTGGHLLSVTWNGGDGSLSPIYTGKAGENQPVNNLQPYEVVGYMWIRGA